MEDETKAHSEQEEKTTPVRVWTTGDSERDWTRFQGQFDRLDGAIRQWLFGLLVFDGLLFIALVVRSMEGGVPSTGLSGATPVVLPLLGVLISLGVFMYLFAQLRHRRTLEKAWDRLAPDSALTPYGVPAREVGTVALATPAMLALCSLLGWGAILLGLLAWYYASKVGITYQKTYHTTILLTTAIGGITLFISIVTFLTLLEDESDPDSK